MSDAAEDASVHAALSWLAASAATITELQIELSEIAAPTGNEHARAEVVAHWLRTAGCEVHRDAVGNVLARRAGREGKPALGLSAHLDSVFDLPQELRVMRPGERSPYADGVTVPPGELHGPGIADDAAGLAALIGIAQALASASVVTRHDVLLIATVGEEGRGNLKGARHLFSHSAGQELSGFITIDHPNANVIVNRGVGSRRYAVEFFGPGGHSWSDYGLYNPAVAMAQAARRVQGLKVPKRVRSSVNIGVMSAGRAVNAIPERASMEVDLRSERNGTLDRLENDLRKAVAAGQDEELGERPSEAARWEIRPIGERPAGETPESEAVVVAAQRALEQEGFTPQLTASSTDANAAMDAGVPAICVSWGGRSGNQHSTREFYAPAGRERSLAAILRMVVDLAGLSETVDGKPGN